MVTLIIGLALLAGGAAYVAVTLFTTKKADRAEQIAAGGAKRLPNPLIFSALFPPFIAPWLLWGGGTIWMPIAALLGFVIGFGLYRVLAGVIGSLAGLILSVLASIVWWLFLMGGFATS